MEGDCLMSRVHDQGKANIGNIYLRNQNHNTNLFIGLYTNATQPAQASDMSGITEVSGGGYARIALTPANWVLQGGQTPEGGSRFNQPQLVYTFSAAVGNVLGYFITTTLTGTSGLLIISDHFAAAINVGQAGFEIRVTPSVEVR